MDKGYMRLLALKLQQELEIQILDILRNPLCFEGRNSTILFKYGRAGSEKEAFLGC